MTDIKSIWCVQPYIDDDTLEWIKYFDTEKEAFDYCHNQAKDIYNHSERALRTWKSHDLNIDMQNKTIEVLIKGSTTERYFAWRWSTYDSYKWALE